MLLNVRMYYGGIQMKKVQVTRCDSRIVSSNVYP